MYSSPFFCLSDCLFAAELKKLPVQVSMTFWECVVHDRENSSLSFGRVIPTFWLFRKNVSLKLRRCPVDVNYFVTSHTESTSTRWRFAFGVVRICSV